MANNYLDNLVAELEQQGIHVPESEKKVLRTPAEEMETQVIESIERASGRKFSEEQRKILDHHGSACILACAGSGKTTTSISLIAKRILTREIPDVNKLIYTTYSKAGATEMKERLDALLKQLGMGHLNVKVQTIHAFFLSVLRTFSVNSGIISSSERSRMIREACKEANFVTKDDDLAILDNLLSFQVNNLLSDKKTIDSYVNTLDDLSIEQYKQIRKSYANKKQEKGLIDYDDMQTMLYTWLIKWASSSNPAEVEMSKNVRQYCKAVYNNFYIDEAQDVSKIQFAIIRAMVEDTNNKGKLDRELVFIGDDDQCIYQWRGSDPSIILSISATFNMRTFVLNTNYRCHKAILEYSSMGIKHNGSRYNKNMNAFNDGGDVRIMPIGADDLCTISIAAMNHIKYWLANGYGPKDIAVLCRNNFHLAILSNMLLREGIYCNVTEDMKLTKSYMYKSVKDIISISEPTWKKDLTASVLWRLCRYMGASVSAKIAMIQDSCALSLEDILGYIIHNFIDTDIEFNKKLSINLQADQEMKMLANRLSEDTKADLVTVYKALTLNDRQEAITTLLFQYLSASSFLYKSKDKNRSIRGLVKYIINLMKKDGVDKMLDFLRVTEQFEGGTMVIPGEKVTLTTMHSAKGREWKNVIMFACDNVSQPSFDGISTLVKDDVPVADIFDTLDEDRRLFYVGNTRAIENLLVLTYMQPSVFILEALGAFGEPHSNNAKILELVSDNNWCENYKSIIDNMILDDKSPYYYDSDKYVVK